MLALYLILSKTRTHTEEYLIGNTQYRSQHAASLKLQPTDKGVNYEIINRLCLKKAQSHLESTLLKTKGYVLLAKSIVFY